MLVLTGISSVTAIMHKTPHSFLQLPIEIPFLFVNSILSLTWISSF